MRSKLTLRSILILISVAFLLLIALGTLALSHLSGRLSRSTYSAWESAESIRVAEELGSAILLYQDSQIRSRLLMADSSTVEPEFSREDLRVRIENAEKFIENDTEARILDETEQEISSYLHAVDTTERDRLNLAAFVAKTSPRLDRANARIHDLIQNNIESARDSVDQARKINLIAHRMGIILAALGLSGTLAVLFALRHFVFLPLATLHASIRRFISGDRTARASEGGPVELHAISRAFNDMADQISRREKDQITFLAGVAHDLRNPLSAMRLPVELLASASAGELLTEQKRHSLLLLLGRQLDRLERMVGDFLDASKIQAGTLELSRSRQDLRDIVRDSVELYETSSPRHRFAVSLPEQPVIFDFDPVRMGQVLNNIISNAVKYSPDGGTVGVTIRASESEVVVTVSDEGVGIAQADQQRIFEPFVRLGVSKDLAPGAGLGLATTQKLVLAHGGRIEVESLPGRGSRFQIRFPIERSSAKAA